MEIEKKRGKIEGDRKSGRERERNREINKTKHNKTKHNKTKHNKTKELAT